MKIKRLSLEEIVKSSQAAPKRQIGSNDEFKDNPAVVYENICSKDWDNKSEVSVGTIVQAFKNAFDTQDLDTINTMMEHVSELKEKRIQEIDNAFDKANFELFEKNLWKGHSSEIFEQSDLNKYLDNGDVQLLIVKKYLEIYYEALVRALPIEDKEASRQQAPFRAARETMMNLLLRTNKKEDAHRVMLMTLDDQPDTLKSFLSKQIEMLKGELSASSLQLKENKISNICRELNHKIKINYEKTFKEFQTKVIKYDNEKGAKNAYNETSINRKVAFLMKMDMQNKLHKLQSSENKGLMLSQEVIDHFGSLKSQE